jgi:Ner family transcriptional regulator
MTDAIPTTVSAKQARRSDARDWPSCRIAYELRLRGLTFRRLSKAAGYHPSTLEQTTRRHNLKWERIIADALGKRPEQIWPSRYKERRPRRARQIVEERGRESSGQAEARS